MRISVEAWQEDGRHYVSVTDKAPTDRVDGSWTVRVFEMADAGSANFLAEYLRAIIY